MYISFIAVYDHLCRALISKIYARCVVYYPLQVAPSYFFVIPLRRLNSSRFRHCKKYCTIQVMKFQLYSYKNESTTKVTYAARSEIPPDRYLFDLAGLSEVDLLAASQSQVIDLPTWPLPSVNISSAFEVSAWQCSPLSLIILPSLFLFVKLSLLNLGSQQNSIKKRNIKKDNKRLIKEFYWWHNPSVIRWNAVKEKH